MKIGGFEIKATLRRTVNVSGKIARRLTCSACKGGEMVFDRVAKVNERVVWVFSQGVGLRNERLGDALYHAVKGCGKAVQFKVRTASLAAQQCVNAATHVASKIAGDQDGEFDSAMMISKAYEEFVKCAKETEYEIYEAGRQLSGKAVYDRAKQHYDKLRKKRQKHQRELNKIRKQVNDAIDQELKLINGCRRRSRKCFARFEKVSKSIAQWKIERYNVTDEFKPKKVAIPHMMTATKVFKDVNFDKNPVWENLKGIITLGLVAEAEIKKVQEIIRGNELALEEEVRKASAENLRWKKTCESLHDIRVSYEDFLAFYDRHVSELDYVLTMLRNTRYCTDSGNFDCEEPEVDVSALPERHHRCLMACDKLSRIICMMSKRKYLEVTDADFSIKQEDLKAFKKNRDIDFLEIKKLLAA